MKIEALAGAVPGGDVSSLCALLRECVHGGASIGFVLPLPDAEVSAYWEGVLADLATGNRLVLVARAGPEGAIVGSAQVAFAAKANGRHRAEIQKVMVLPSQRRRGIAAALLAEAEASSRKRGIRILHLDTSDGRGGARDFYEALGYSYVGGIPDYALDPDGTPVKNAIYYKPLE
jgi:ribosomal protein S18 acetylase RimI-like enzyme